MTDGWRLGPAVLSDRGFALAYTARRMGLMSTAGVSFGLLLMAASALHAQGDPAFGITLETPAGCPSAQALTEEVEARTGRSAASGRGDALSIDVRVEAVAQGYRALVSIRDAGGRALGSRELTAGACADLEPMLVLVIASSLGVSPGEAAHAPLPPPPPAAARPTHDEPEDEPPQVAESGASQPALPWTLDLELTGLMLTGLASAPSMGAGLGLWVEHGAFALRAAGSFVPGTWMSPEPDLRLMLAGGIGELDACAAPARGSRVLFAFCAGVQGGALYARAEPLARGEPRWDALLQAVPSVRLRVSALSSIGVALGLGATIPLVFPSYSYSDAGSVSELHAIELGMFAEFALWIRLGS